jgi:hypothetical protein
MIDKTKFTEILPGLWYENATGLPWSSRRKGFIPLKTKDTCGYYSVYDNRMVGWHRIVWQYFNGSIPTDMVVDHKDNNITNNIIDNLQLLCRKQNARKCKKYKNNSSGYSGVKKKGNKYNSKIVLNNKDIHLGSFDTPEEAYKVYLDAKIKYHGKESINPLKEKI